MVVSLPNRHKALGFNINNEIWKMHPNDESSIAITAN